MEGAEGTGNDLVQVSPLHSQAFVWTKNALLPRHAAYPTDPPASAAELQIPLS